MTKLIFYSAGLTLSLAFFVYLGWAALLGCAVLAILTLLSSSEMDDSECDIPVVEKPIPSGSTIAFGIVHPVYKLEKEF